MSGMMLHGLGDCTPELNCGCMAKSPRDMLRKRITRALWDNRYPGVEQTGPLADLALTDADAVIAALGLVEGRERRADARPRHRRWVTPWERIEDDA